MQPPMGVVPPQLPPGSMMPGTGMFMPPPPLGMPLGMTPGMYIACLMFTMCVHACVCVKIINN